jgi:hypothetical protein
MFEQKPMIPPLQSSRYQPAEGLSGTRRDAAPAYCDSHIASMKHEDAAANFTALLGLPLP